MRLAVVGEFVAMVVAIRVGCVVAGFIGLFILFKCVKY